MLELDKQLHFIISFGLVLALNSIVGLFWSIVVTFIIGLLKECYDEYKERCFSIKDLIANIIGILVAVYYIKVLF